jgi:uncharacterized membrane protein
VVFARENVDYWYIKDFNSHIVVNKDSSLDITERIEADCGSAAGKHGIFRILPTQIKLADGRVIDTPVALASITDFNSNPVKFTESRDAFNHTVIWKIGDSNKTVQGENDYVIRYKVKNAIRFGSLNFDELYWNLSGNFWDIPIDSFSGEINFPEEVSQGNSQVDYYTGNLGSKSKDLANYKWSLPNVLEFSSTGTLEPGQGITASVSFPKNIFILYNPGVIEKYGGLLSIPFIFPFLALIICFIVWFKYGKDPKALKTIIAEYEPPDNLSPIELGMLKTQGSLKNEFITAEIVNLAVKGALSIKEVEKDYLVFHAKDYEFIKSKDARAEASLNQAQRIIFGNIFKDGDVVKMPDLKKNKFYACLKELGKKGKEILAEKGLIVSSSIKLKKIFLVAGIFLVFAGFFTGNIFWLASLAVSGIIVLVFGAVMSKYTPKGAEVNWKIKGFKLYMKTAEKHRSRFQEKENIFEKFLPYAIVFGITGLWIKKMKEIYGDDFYKSYAPVWFAGNAASFDVDSLTSTINSLSAGIAANTSAPSGAGGAGGAGGGGGGGGGGGW